MNPSSTAPVIVSLLALGMALAFVVADRRTPSSKALAGFLTCVAMAIAAQVLVWQLTPPVLGVRLAVALTTVPQVMSFLLGNEWVLRVRDTIPAGNLNTRGPNRLLRAAQGLAVFYGLAALAYPELHDAHFSSLVLAPGERVHASFWLFAVPTGLSVLLTIAATLFTLNRRPDRSEARRLVSFAIATPVMALGVVVPPHMAPLAGTLGLLTLLVGSVQYHVAQGQRAQFLSRFLSPQVADMVTRRGMQSATEERTLELSVVCCDLRGFTAFSATTAPEHVIAILREYYDMVGAATADSGGTIKDQAGDGVLILVGAPIPYPDHAARALELARRIRDAGQVLTRRWSDEEMHLGMGVGVASGYVTVGVIGSASRLEYTAVGSPVNLACRLCAEAEDGEVLVDARACELLGSAPQHNGLAQGAPLRLKGFAEPMPNYVLSRVEA